MRILNYFKKNLEITDKDWFYKLTLKSSFTLNGLKINDLEDKIDKKYKVTLFNNSENDIRKIYRCPDFKNHYKVKNGVIIGLGRVIKRITKNDFLTKFGKPNSEEIIIGEIYHMECFEIEGYDLLYDNFRIVIDSSKERLESIQFGEKLLYGDE